MQLLPLSMKDLSCICCSCGKPQSINIPVFWATMFGRLTCTLRRVTQQKLAFWHSSARLNQLTCELQRCRHKGQQPGEGSSSMPRILHSRIPKTGAVASSRRVQTARHSWRVILTYLLLLYPHLDKFLLFEKCANYVRYFCVTMCKNYVLNRALV